ncbi:MAG: SURF1 family protein [Pseudomonadota bacterium]
MADAADTRRGLRGGIILPLFFGLGGFAILVWLCLWQIQRLEWKEALTAEVTARAAGPEMPLPTATNPERDRYRPVFATGQMAPNALFVLTSQRFEGPGFRVISAFETDGGRRILVDRGFVPEAAKEAPLPSGPMRLAGNLDWPRERDFFTPEPNLERNIWFARDVATMAEALGTEPLLLVARTQTGAGGPRPIPVTVRLVNNHLQYAITWGLMAAAWLAMTVLLTLRIRSTR